ncbi:MAG: stage III sporulation protein AE [Candidatus Limivicinus sp.]
MKKFVLLLLILPFFTVSAHADELIDEAAEIAGVNELNEALPDDAGEISGKIDSNGKYDSKAALGRLWNKIVKNIVDELRDSVKTAAALVGIGLVTSLAGTLCRDKNIAGYINAAAVCSGALVLVNGISSIISQTSDALERLSEYSKAALPAVFTAAASCGAAVSSSAKYGIACISIDLLMGIAQSAVIPLAYAFLALSLSNSIFESPMLKSCQRLTKWLATTLMTVFIFAFSTIITVSGIVSGSADALSVKAARTVISTVLPVVGGIISDAASSVLLAASAIKNSAGVMSLIAVCALCAGPFVMLSVKMLVFRAAAAACELIPNIRLSAFINDVGKALSILLGLLGCCAIMMFISFMSAIKAVA